MGGIREITGWAGRWGQFIREGSFTGFCRGGGHTVDLGQGRGGEVPLGWEEMGVTLEMGWEVEELLFLLR